MMRLYKGCGTRRLTSTTMVFCIFVDTTSPTFSFLNPFAICVSAMLFVLRREFPLAQDGLEAGAVSFQTASLLESFHLSHGHLKIETKKLLVHFMKLLKQCGVVWEEREKGADGER